MDLTERELTRIVERLRNLQTLAERAGTPAEAAAAAAALQSQLFKYNLSLAVLEHDGSTSKSEYRKHDFTLSAPARQAQWHRDLVYVLARYNFCRGYQYGKTERMGLLGQEHNVTIVLGLYEYLHKTLTRLADRGFANHRREGGREHGIAYKASFLRGAVSGVEWQLQQQAAADWRASEQSSALVVCKDAELQAAWDSCKWAKPVKPTRTASNASAMRDGYEAGKRVSLARQVGDGSTDAPRLSA